MYTYLVVRTEVGKDTKILKVSSSCTSMADVLADAVICKVFGDGWRTFDFKLNRYPPNDEIQMSSGNIDYRIWVVGNKRGEFVA